jgi:hypothetical protein
MLPFDFDAMPGAQEKTSAPIPPSWRERVEELFHKYWYDDDDPPAELPEDDPTTYQDEGGEA